MAGKRPAPRLQILDDKQMNAQQRTLVDALRSGPRGHSIQIRGPFAAFLHAPVFGNLAQDLGAHCRYKTACRPGSRNSPFCARRGCGARNMNGLRMSRWL